MLTISLIMGMVALTWYFGGVEEAQRNPNMDPDSIVYAQSVEVPLKRNRQGHYLVNGYINNNEVEFLLDTGATDVVIPEHVAHGLGLPFGQRGRAMTANGPITIFRTEIDELRIGEIRLYNVPASINPSVSMEEILLGMTALGRIEFTQRDDVLTLHQKAG